jgi:hypothetical protein
LHHLAIPPKDGLAWKALVDQIRRNDKWMTSTRLP